MSTHKLFEMGGQWIGRVAGSSLYYRFWYDARNGEVRRRSLKTANIEEAKRRLAVLVTKNAGPDPRDPDTVMLVLVLTHYFENHSDKLPSGHAARRAGELVMAFLENECGFGPEAKVGQFTKSFQARFALWAVEKHNHTPSYISRNLSVIAAACRFATKTAIQTLPDGRLQEARLLKFMPEVCFDTKWIAEITDRPEPKPRDYVPTFEDMASLLGMEASETLRRYDIIALNTWARPEAILDLSVRAQVDFEHSLIDLNPPSRKQTKKRRPIIRLTENLRGWLELWGEDRPLSYRAQNHIDDDTVKPVRRSVTYIKGQFNRRSVRWMLTHYGLTKAQIDDLFRFARGKNTTPLREAIAAAERSGINRITRYTFRHFMATRVRGLAEVRVDREQRSLWLGHSKRDATSWYETHDPEYLRECARATSLILEKLDHLTDRPLVPMSVKQRKALGGLAVLDNTRSINPGL